MKSQLPGVFAMEGQGCGQKIMQNGKKTVEAIRRTREQKAGEEIKKGTRIGTGCLSTQRRLTSKCIIVFHKEKSRDKP